MDKKEFKGHSFFPSLTAKFQLLTKSPEKTLQNSHNQIYFTTQHSMTYIFGGYNCVTINLIPLFIPRMITT